MKKIGIIIGIIIIVVLAYAAFSGGTDTSNKANVIVSEKVVVLSTFTIIADMVGEVGGDKVESLSLTKPGSEIHGYQPTPDDLVQASRGQVMFENGMGLELWTEKLRASIPEVPIVTVSEGVEVIQISEDVYAGKPNPHAWMSPQQGLQYVENIRAALTEIAPQHADTFAANAAIYSEKITAVDVELETSLATLPENNRFLVTCEGAFSYLASDYNLEEVYLWAINSESQGSPQQVVRVIETVNENSIPAVFCESTVEPRIQQEVVEATGVKFGGILYVDSLSNEDGPASSYLALLEHTADTIIRGLTE